MLRLPLKCGVLPLAFVTWGTLVAAGMGSLHLYESTPGGVGKTPPTWPAGSGIHLDRDRLNLVMLAHPRCPCTRASLDDLSRIMARCDDSVAAHVVFFQPGNWRECWGKTDIWQHAAAIPGVRVIADFGGEEAVRFGAETSGTVLLYDRDGRLLFAGGITAGRGKVGGNAGLDAVSTLLSGGSGGCDKFPVFGCPIRNVSVEERESSRAL